MRFLHPIMTIGILVGYPAAWASATCPVVETLMSFVDPSHFIDISGDRIANVVVGHSEGVYTIACDPAVTRNRAPPQPQSAVFAVQDTSPELLVIKYATTCGLNPWQGDMLIKNYEMTKLIKEIETTSGLKLTPEVVLLSKAHPLFNSQDAQFRTLAVDALCKNNLGEGRFMIMKRAGPNLKHIIDQRPAVGGGDASEMKKRKIETLHVGMKLFRKLAVLHDHGIVHGDITQENILLAKDSGTRNPNLSASDFVFVDWDRSFVDKCEKFFQSGKFDVDAYKIPGEADAGSMVTDVQRVVIVLAQMLRAITAGYGTEFEALVDTLERSTSAQQAENAIRSLVDRLAASMS